MRNLAIASTSFRSFPAASLTRVVFDVENDCTYMLSESPNAEPGVEIEIFKLQDSKADEEFPVPCASFTVPSFPARKQPQVVSLHYLSESQSLALITLGGDIGLVSVEEHGIGEFEVIGSIDSGIKAASWSPDDSLVVLLTGEDKILLMTSAFDVISESEVHSSNRGEAQPVNVGWGSKQTQFHGSLGKAAAQVPQPSLDAFGSSPDDDNEPRISWRGDGAFFVVSSLENVDARPRRVLRVYDRASTLQNTSEPVAGLEHPCAWRPSGNLIASTQRFGFEGGGAGREGRHDVVFFERNGLRHGEFGLREIGRAQVDASSTMRWGYKVKELVWNAESNVLAVWIVRDEGDLVQLWTTGNYHWYLKQEIVAHSGDECPSRFTSVMWHPENALRLFLTTSTHFLEHTFAWETMRSLAQPPNDTGSVAVVDGTTLLLTQFRTQNVPPPMASCSLSVRTDEVAAQSAMYHGRAPVHVSFSQSDSLAVLHLSGHVQLWKLNARAQQSPGKAIDPTKLCDIDLKGVPDVDADLAPHQIHVVSSDSAPDDFQVACLASSAETDVLVDVLVQSRIVNESRTVHLPGKDGRLMESFSRDVYWQSRDGVIFEVGQSKPNISRVAGFSEFCFSSQCVPVAESILLFVGRAESGKIYYTSANATSCNVLSAGCTSFTIASGFVIYTTASHDAFFAPLKDLYDLLVPEEAGSGSGDAAKAETRQWEKRRVERGSRIVTAVPSTMSLVLQMPRGNLETIYPRPMVLDVVKQDIEGGQYRKAFLACRKHRIDLSILVEHNATTFLENTSSFIEQIDDVDYLNLFLTSLGQSVRDPAKLSEYCDAVRVDLEKRDLTKYVNSILTAYVVKKPADYESGLSLLLRLRDISNDLVEEAVKYIIFLVDADRLFDTALGMYDFSLVLLIAQHSQRDPREYLPFLRELRALPKYYQQFKIDDHLKRHLRALNNLSLAGPEYLDEALVYTEKHRLYTDALAIWKDSRDKYKRALDIYGEYLFERRDFKQAALVFVDSKSYPKAMVAYERALLWRELFDLAMREDTDEETLQEMAYRVADELLSKKKYDEAARVFGDYAKNIRQCVRALAQGNLFSEARRIITLRSAPELITEILHPAALDGRTQIAEELEEMRSQLHKQVERLKELRVKKEEEPDVFYGLDDDPALHGVDVMTDVSMPATAFTRYTIAPTATSRASKRTSRSKRKMERKIGSGKKGTIDEEEYLLNSLGKLVTRFDTVQGETASLLPHLLQFTPEHRNEARSLQNDVSGFRAELQSTLDEIWPEKVDGFGGPDSNGSALGSGSTMSWAERMEEKRREKKNAVEKIPKPEITTAEGTWKASVLDI